ncbi:MAG: RHS repeat-associated core domain-containing protein [Candidatus Competibacter sp.]|nr:RHS repeat-associated core domain-containing protein [Candidatus Competibacter sp.]
MRNRGSMLLGILAILGSGFLLVADPVSFAAKPRTPAARAAVVQAVAAGDINGDGVVNALDVVAVINHLLGLQSWPGADVNGDGVVNALDVVFVINQVLGIAVNQAPQVHAGADQTITLPAAANLSGTVSDDGLPNPPGAVTIAWSKDSGPGTVAFGNAHVASTTATFGADGVYVLRLTANDGALPASDTVQVTVNPVGGGTLPPDPADVAPPVDPTVTTTIGVATEFLYTGGNPIQTGVAPGTIEAKRAAVLRGRVLDKQNNPLSGVTLTVLNHPEFGQTLSRADGGFDMAVNGGGWLTVNYRKVGYLPAQRQVNAPWQDYVVLDDVVLIARDAQATTVDLTQPTVRVAQGSAVTDQDGTRQATLLIPPGTTAQVYNPDGTTRTVSSLTLRATEYTVGANGPQTMPAPLPPTSGYTYAVELSADEATMKKDGQDVLFNQPVPFYVENFLNFPVGGEVPVGYYDNTKGAWIPSENGRVIKILGVAGGRANLDVTGSGQPADAAALAALGITDAERERLAGLYPAGKSLWRVRLTHLSTWDCNWPFGPPPDAEGSKEKSKNEDDHRPDDECRASGSVIGCESQTLGEVIPLVGTSLSLNYRSDRVPGHLSARTLKIPLSGDTIPASLKRIEASVNVAGRSIDLGTFPAQTNQTTTFTWDGQNAYKQVLQGRQPATVKVGYVYDGVYQSPVRFGEASGVTITGSRTRQEVTLWRSFETYVGVFDLRQAGVAGWSLDVHHIYNPMGKVLYQGNGTQRSAENVKNIIITLARSSTTPFAVYIPEEVAVGIDGSIFIAEAGNNRIQRVGPDGIITTFAGTGQAGFSGDGGPATQAKLYYPEGVAVAADGSVFIADTYNSRIRRVGPDGITTTFAGTGQAGFSGDGGPATQAKLYYPEGVAVAADGSVFIADSLNGRIRQVGPDGIITTFAGTGQAGFSGDGGPATLARLSRLGGVAVAADGSVFIADTYNSRIRRVGPDGIITTFAGTGQAGFSGDGGPATLARLNYPDGIAVAADGSVFIAEANNNRIRRVGPDGIITTSAGTGQKGYSGDGGPATQAQLGLPEGVAVAADGSVFIADTNNGRIRRILNLLPEFDLNELSIASTDGRLLYRFDQYGRHLSTVDTFTGAPLYTFAYDSAGRLSSITDADNNITTIERDGNGNPTALVAPFGQRTTLSVDGNGYLASVTNPAGETYQMQYTADGLLTRFTDPLNHASQFAYDALGRLRNDANAAGGSQTLARTELADGYTVTRGTALNRTTAYTVEDRSTGDRRRTIVTPDGLTTQTLLGTNGSAHVTAPDGTVTDSLDGPDPRFGMQAPITSSSTVTTGGLTATTASAATVNPAAPTDLLTFNTLTRTATINGRTSTSVYDKATRKTTVTSAAGRQGYSVLDAKGRVIEVGVTGLEPITISYDARGRLSSFHQGSGADARTTTFNYNVAGYLQSATDALGHSGQLEYDDAGRVIVQTLANGQQIDFGYDAKGNLTSLTPPGQPAHGFTYNAVDLATSYLPPTVPGGGDTGYEYNADQQLTKITRPDGGVLSYAYDAAGRLSTLTIPAGQYGYSYNAAGQLSGITAPGGLTLAYGYAGSLLTSATWSGGISGSVGFGYDTDFRVNQIMVNGANPVAYQYDADSLLIQAGDLTYARDADNGLLTGSTLGSVNDSTTYNGFGEPTQYLARANATDLLNIAYTRDKLGRITQKVETVSGGAAVTYDYGYDAIGQLIEVKQNGATVANYVYDANGNRLSKTAGGSTVTGAYDAQDRMLTYGNATYTYTANGELKTKVVGGQTTAYDYDALGNLRGVTLPSGTQIAYLIDGKNRRVGKKVNGALVQGFLYQGWLQLAAELDSSGAIVSRFVYGKGINVPDYMVKGGATYRIVTDHLGSPRLVVNTATGAIEQRMDYDEYGNVLTDTNPGFQPFGFAGGIYDRDTGLVRFGARDYEAVSGRWMSKDQSGLANDLNSYRYAINNPTVFRDINGKDVTLGDALCVQAAAACVLVPTPPTCIVAGLSCLDNWMGNIDERKHKYKESLLEAEIDRLNSLISDLKFLLKMCSEERKRYQDELRKTTQELADLKNKYQELISKNDPFEDLSRRLDERMESRNNLPQQRHPTPPPMTLERF